MDEVATKIIEILRKNMKDPSKPVKLETPLSDLEIESLDELLLGPTGLTFVEGDPVGPAKVLEEFAKGHETFTIKGGLLGAEFLTPEKIAELASIEPREVLLAMLAGAMQAPMANLAGLLAALPRNTASVLQQLLEKKEAEEQATVDSSESIVKEAPEAEQASDSGDEDSTTEDDSDATVAAAAEADADEKTEDQDDETDESSNDDAGEE